MKFEDSLRGFKQVKWVNVSMLRSSAHVDLLRKVRMHHHGLSTVNMTQSENECNSREINQNRLDSNIIRVD